MSKNKTLVQIKNFNPYFKDFDNSKLLHMCCNVVLHLIKWGHFSRFIRRSKTQFQQETKESFKVRSYQDPKSKYKKDKLLYPFQIQLQWCIVTLVSKAEHLDQEVRNGSLLQWSLIVLIPELLPKLLIPVIDQKLHLYHPKPTRKTTLLDSENTRRTDFSGGWDLAPIKYKSSD